MDFPLKSWIIKEIAYPSRNIPAQKTRDVKEINIWNSTELWSFCTQNALDMISKLYKLGDNLIMESLDELKKYVLNKYLDGKRKQSQTNVAIREPANGREHVIWLEQLRRLRHLQLKNIPAQNDHDAKEMVAWNHSNLNTYSKMSKFLICPENVIVSMDDEFWKITLKRRIRRNEKGISAQRVQDVKDILRWNKSDLKSYTEKELHSIVAALNKPKPAQSAKSFNYKGDSSKPTGNFVYEMHHRENKTRFRACRTRYAIQKERDWERIRKQTGWKM